MAALRICVCILVFSAIALSAACGDENFAVGLPDGVQAVWDLGKAERETTETRERACINGLWRWQPAGEVTDSVPGKGWGYFKVPGCWPGITDYMQKDSQTVFAHSAWKAERLGTISAAWYQREIRVPENWVGRRITLTADYVNSIATVFVDGTRTGEVRFPGGDLDLTAACRPGVTHVLSILVQAAPLKDVLLSYSDTNTAREVRGRVARRGLCGDLFLVSTPATARLADIKLATSVRRGEIALDVGVQQPAADRRYTVAVQIERDGRNIASFSSPPFKAAELAQGRLRFTHAWNPDARWDLHTPANMHTVRCSLVEADDGRVCDAQF